MESRALFLPVSFVTLTLVSLGGCSESNPVQEPWVTVGGSYLQSERSRSAGLENELRQRLVSTQTDR